MSGKLNLRGITWNHPRGFAPLAATAQRYMELHPDIKISWEKRSLKAFEDSPVERLALDYDLIVLDHPCISRVAQSGALQPLDEFLAPNFFADQAAHSIGQSHISYTHDGHHWALAIDAATPVSFWRGDLLAQLGIAPPQTWPEVIALARKGHVEVPAAPINCLMNFYTLCLSVGEEPFINGEHSVTSNVGLAALGHLRELLVHCDDDCWSRNPIASHDLVASAANTQLAYCPLAYGYSNYARAGFAPHVLTFGDTPSFNGTVLRTTLGGAGLGVSALRPYGAAAAAYAEFVASPTVQRTLYTHSGGQPGYRAAWLDPENNRLTGDYFMRTLPALDRAYLRPRFPGYLQFQERGALIVHAALRGKLTDRDALNQLDATYRDSLLSASPAA